MCWTNSETNVITLLSRAVSCGDTELDKELWAKTLKEVDKTRAGPYGVDQLPAGAFDNNRFPIREMIRPTVEERFALTLLTILLILLNGSSTVL